MARHQLPAYIHARNLQTVLRFSSEIVSDKDKAVICDAVELTFVDPAGLCILAATCHKLASLGKKLELENMPREIARYLARMDLFKACGIRYDENFVRHNRAGDLVELCMLDKRANIDDCAARMAHALVGSIPGLDPRAKLDEMTGFSPYNLLYVPLVYILNEFLENALTHGRRGGFKDAVAWIAAQYYAAKDRICLAVIDDGCGFLGSLRKHQDLHDKTHLGATRLALLPRVTCNPDLELRSSETANQGIGLTIIKEMTNRSRGVIRMGSGDHVLELSGGGAERPYRITDWQGVILALEFKRDLLRQVNVHQVIKALRDLPSPQGLRFE